MSPTTRNILIVVIAIAVAAVCFAITRNALDTVIAGSACFVADAVLRLTKTKKPTVVKKSILTPPQK